MLNPVVPMPMYSIENSSNDSNADRFDRLYGEHADAIFRFIAGMLSHGSDCDDCFQETWMKVHRALPRYRAQSGSDLPWLCTIARNVVYDWFRKHGRLTTANRPEDRIIQDQPDQRLVAQEEDAAIQAAIQSISPKVREVYLLRIEQGLSYKEISAITGEPTTRLMGRMQVAKQQLTAAWQQWREQS